VFVLSSTIPVPLERKLVQHIRESWDLDISNINVINARHKTNVALSQYEVDLWLLQSQHLKCLRSPIVYIVSKSEHYTPLYLITFITKSGGHILCLSLTNHIVTLKRFISIKRKINTGIYQC